jgi:hypothetical protein
MLLIFLAVLSTPLLANLLTSVADPDKNRIHMFFGLLDPDPVQSISQRHGSADPDPDPHQNVMIRNTASNQTWYTAKHIAYLTTVLTVQVHAAHS